MFSIVLALIRQFQNQRNNSNAPSLGVFFMSLMRVFDDTLTLGVCEYARFSL